MSSDDKGAGGVGRPVSAESPAPDSGGSGARSPDKPPGRGARARASVLPADPELERYRRRLDERLAPLRDAQSLKRSGRPQGPVERAPPAPSWLKALQEMPRWLVVASIIGVLAIGGMAWWTLGKPPPVVAATYASAPPPRGELEALEQALQQERDKTEQLSHELTVVWRELGVRTLALADKAALERELVDLHQTLDQTEQLAGAYERMLAQERQRGRMLDEQLAARRESASAATAGQEIAVLRAALKQAEERATGYGQSLSAAREDKAAREQEVGTLQQALAQERQRNQALEEQLAADKAARQREVDSLRQALRQAEEQSADRELLLTQERDRLEAEIAARAQMVAVSVDKPARTGPVADKAGDAPAAVASAVGLDLPRLMARARLLLVQGDIGAARSVLERAAESGDAPALFALAETFDPAVLSVWGALGTQGDAARAQELYARALAGGLIEAKERMATPQ